MKEGRLRSVAAGALMFVGAGTVLESLPGVNLNPLDRANKKAQQVIENINPIKPDVDQAILEALPGKLRDLGNLELVRREWDVTAYKAEGVRFHIWGTDKDINIPKQLVGEGVTRRNKAYARTIMPLEELPDGSVILNKELKTITIVLPGPTLDEEIAIPPGEDIDGQAKTKRDPGLGNHLLGINTPMVETDELDVMIAEEVLRRSRSDSGLFDRSNQVAGDKIKAFTQGVIRDVLRELGVPEAERWIVITNLPLKALPQSQVKSNTGDVKIDAVPMSIINL